MVKERIDPDLPNIVLDNDDRAAFQKQRASQSKTPVEPEDSNTSKSGVSGLWLALTLVIALGACGASYWLYEQKRISDAELTNAVGRVAELERRLSATGEEMDQSAGALRVTVSELTDKTDELWSQMDKLWASAWRKNQAELAQLNERLNKSVRETNNKISVVETESSTLSTNLAVIQEQLTQQSVELSQLATLIAETRESGNGSARQIGDIQSRLVALDQVNGALTRRVAELEKWRRDAPAESSPSGVSVP
ncbi:hypothetical protein [Aliiglaciecola sp. M165]|uniref:hypothetical protein n=1 Tax=Aliiglaciecola sp. M165 TaxID=2593649 RepID=UPI00117E34B1|nr:hypothetical protein [Aliiglaciecola sp. M165]TRY29583.1 hypothetical protein FM019_19580 [Aliiglaciecola sp. M165]